MIAAPEETGHIAVPGGRVWYRINGLDKLRNTPLVVIRGGPGFSHDYLLTLTDLASSRPVILYDQLDTGNSDHPGIPANWTVERFVLELEAVRCALKLDPVFVLGTSWGGAIAAEYAAKRPPGLIGLVLHSPLLSTKRWIADNAAYRKQLPTEVQQTLDQHEAAGTTDSEAYRQAVMEFYKRHLNRMDPWPDELVSSFELANLDLYKTMWGNTEFSVTGTLIDFDVTSRLGQISVPTIFVCGEFDEASPQACRDFARLVPNSTVKVIPGASHTAHLERPDLFLQILREFFARVSGEPVSVNPRR